MNGPTVRRDPHRIAADPSRVVAQLFVPGQEGFDQLDSRTVAVLDRLLRLDDDEIERTLSSVRARFDGRHRDLLGVFERHAAAVADRLETGSTMATSRRLLIGATFTSEYTIEGAALCNPSIVAHPDQSGLGPGELRFVLSVRAIGEGHRSTIGFRIGVVDRSGRVTPDERPRFANTGTTQPATLHAAIFRSELRRLDGEGENADWVLNSLPAHFTPAELERRLASLDEHAAARHGAHRTAQIIRGIAARSYAVEFPDSSGLAERVLWPSMRAEQNGMEDARFVRFTDPDGAVTYYATYTAYDGVGISQQLLATTDFRTFTSSPLVGGAALNKGLALFPRHIDGRWAALSRWDRETNSIAFSDDVHIWPTATPFQTPRRSWELLQLGNCGSPIETPEGWLVLTHGVGPMRTYSIGAVLLDLDEPTRVVGELQQPLLTPDPDEQDGYVPNVVYTCGALVHGDQLILPYGIGDAAVGFVSVVLAELLDAIRVPAAR